MTEFWESLFQDNQELWGMKATATAISALELFKRNGLKKILIPGFGYGRNAQIFTDSGFQVTGIEISETAINLAKKHFGDSVNVHHGSVSAMPFDQELYDGVFCYALIHLLNAKERQKLIQDCYNQLKPGGLLVFIAISKNDIRYGRGKEIEKDTFEIYQGISLYFYDLDSVEAEFGNYGLIEATEIDEHLNDSGSKFIQRFFQLICRK